MRSETEMMDLINHFIATAPNIRAEILNGSWANPNVEGDIFQDYDVCCFVHDVAPYRTDRTFVEQFGELMIV